MAENFNVEAFRSKANSVLSNKSLVATNDYIIQLENLLNEFQPENAQMIEQPGINELLGYLEKAKSRINGLFYNAPVAYCVLNEKGFIVTTNKAFCNLFNLDQSSIDGEDLRKYLHTESIEIFDFQVNKIISTKTTLSTNLRFIRREKDIIIRFQTTFYNEGDINYLQCIATDISDTKAIENELAASEAQFRNLLEASPVGNLVLYKDKYIYSNRAAANLFGYDNPDELIGLKAIDTISEESKPKFKERIARLESNMPNMSTEGVFVCKNGQLKTCISVSIPVIYNNRVAALIIITEASTQSSSMHLSLENEKSYKEMYQLVRLMCDNVPDMIWAKNLNNEYIFTNKAICDGLLNASDTSEPIGKTDMFYAERERDNNPGNPEWHTFGEICRDTDTAVLQSMKTQRFNEYGNIKGEFLNLDVYKAPFYDTGGKIIGTVGSGRNVTHEYLLQLEHDKTLEQLKHQTTRLNAVISVLPDLLFILNTEGDFVDFFTTDPGKLALDPARIKSLNLNHLFQPEEVERQLEIYRRCIETNSVQSFDYTLIIDGKELYYETRTAPLSTNTILAIVRDITEIKLNELQIKKYTEELFSAKVKAEKSDQLKSAFLANMSHEIRTPMNSIMGFADLLNDSDLNEEKRREFTDIIIKRSGDLLQIINDVLDISYIESGNASVHYANCDLNLLLDKLYATFSSKLQLKPAFKVRLICEKAVSLGQLFINIDELKLQQIFVNLLDNAIKFTEKGTIQFGYRMPSNGTITCFVSDTGIGIDSQFTEIIFERFVQADIPNRNKYKGTGLGLAICKGNTDLMGGQIKVVSEPGKGSNFIFELPFVQLLEDGSKNPSQKIISGFNWKNKNIVVVEDDEQNVKYLQTILRKTGASIFLAPDGEAFRQLLIQIPDIELILMDIQLPDEDGWQLTKYSKSVRSDIPVIAQTAFGMESDRTKSHEAGCDNFIAKPIAPEELLKIMALYLER